MFAPRGSSRARRLALTAVPLLIAAGCANNDSASTSGGGGAQCDDFPRSDIEFVVPYSAGGGFDTWARVIAPVMAEELSSDVNMPVVNREGAGGITGVTEVFGSPPDGSRLAVTDPGILATAQISGTSDLDFSELSVIGRLTVGPEVIVVHADSPWNSIEDVQAAAQDGPLLMGTGGLAAVNIVSFDALELPFENVVHDGSSEALVSVIRGDTDIALFPLNSVAEGIRSGDLKPLLLVGTPPEDANPDADVVDGVATLDEATGQDGLGSALEQHRLVVAAPDTPDCMIDTLDEALRESLADDGVQTKLDEGGLVTAHLEAAEGQDVLQNTVDTLNEYEDLLRNSFEG